MWYITAAHLWWGRGGKFTDIEEKWSVLSSIIMFTTGGKRIGEGMTVISLNRI